MAAFALLATVSEALVVGPGLAPGNAVQVHRASLPRRRALRVGRQAVSLRSVRNHSARGGAPKLRPQLGAASPRHARKFSLPSPPPQARAPVVSMASAGGFVPDMERRNVMNLVLVAGAALPVGWLGGGFIYFLVPPGGGTRK